MKYSLIKLLRCNFCGATLRSLTSRDSRVQEIEWNILECTGCSNRYPVVFGIPIMKAPHHHVDVHAQTTKHGILQRGPLVEELLYQIESGQTDSIQRSLLSFKPHRESFIPERLSKLIGRRYSHYLHKIIVEISLQDYRWRRKETTIFKKLKSATTAVDFMKIYYRDLMKNEIYNYFAYRFGQPRHLVATCLATIFPESRKPILDLACGIGHLVHFLTSRNSNQPVIGLDRNFSQLYIAKKFVAPAGEYVCAEADEPLPFPNESFSGVLCSDAFHYFLYRLACVRELQRIVFREGVIILTRVGNSLLSPHEGYEITPRQYKNLFCAMPNIVVGEDMILEKYLQKHGPNLSKEPQQDQLNKVKWLSLVATHGNDVFQDHGEFIDWPHALGRLRVNPLYHNSAHDQAGDIIFQFRFPSQWYEFEDHGWLKYAPETLKIAPNIIDELSRGIRTPEIEQLIAKFAIIGMPQYYM